MDAKISVVIPAFNEQDNIDPLYRELKGVLDSVLQPSEILFIDDGSTDLTFQRIETIHEKDASVKAIKFRKNFGQSAALQAGFDHATGTLVITMDADLQNDPHNIPALVEKLEQENLDVVCGWRHNRHDAVSKKLFSKFANRMRRSLTSEIIHDSGCTLRIYRTECVKDLELYGELHRYIPAILQWKGYRIGELPVNHRERASGSTKYSWKRIRRGFLDLLVVTFWQKYSVRPMHIFGGIGLVMCIFGFITGSYLVFSRLFYGTLLMDRPLFYVSLFLIVLGVQFLALGIIADILLKIYYGQNGRKSYLEEKLIW